VEANIGAGKSTFLKKIENLGNSNVKVVYEPVDVWIKSGLLGKFYSDKKRWSYTFQNFAYITKIMALSNLNPNITYIVERSPFVDKYCFAKMCYDNNMMDETEWHIYNYWFDYLITNLNINYKIIYLDTNTDICLNRIRNRDRGDENVIDIKYLELLEQYMSKWLDNEPNIIRLDGNLGIDDTTNINTVLNLL
jgi:deoxyadenosine/deoxycytidine kinase